MILTRIRYQHRKANKHSAQTRTALCRASRKRRSSQAGGVYSTAADIHAMWRAFRAGRIVSQEWVAEMVRPRSHVPSKTLPMRYGLGFWLHDSHNAVMLHGFDAGASFRTVHDPISGFTHTVLSNTTQAAWPMSRRINELFVVSDDRAEPT